MGSSVRDTLTPGGQTISPEQLRCASHYQDVCLSGENLGIDSWTMWRICCSEKKMELFEVICLQTVKRKKVMV